MSGHDPTLKNKVSPHIQTQLPEFVQFSIKIVLQGTNAAQPPRIKNLRIIALAE